MALTFKSHVGIKNKEKNRNNDSEQKKGLKNSPLPYCFT
jgi:hypothetical protein